MKAGPLSLLLTAIFSEKSPGLEQNTHSLVFAEKLNNLQYLGSSILNHIYKEASRWEKETNLVVASGLRF